MIWLLDLIEDHRGAVKYDLLKHGYRLEWLSTPRLPWGDAVAILAMQPPATSAVYRELYPEDYDRTRQLAETVERLEVIAVVLQRGQMLLGNQTDVSETKLPSSFADLFGKPEIEQFATEEQILAEMAEFNRIIGRPDDIEG